jgi:hypothetical protein
MTPNKGPMKRGSPEKSSKSKREGDGAMTWWKILQTTLNEEWANKMQNI